MNRKSRHIALQVCVVATLLLRAAIPAGYMPAGAGNALLFEMCPSAVPADLLMAIAGSTHAHHHHGGDSDESHFNAEQCPIGQLLSVAVAVDIAYPLDAAPAAMAPNGEVAISRGSTTPLNRRSRSPPA